MIACANFRLISEAVLCLLADMNILLRSSSHRPWSEAIDRYRL